MTVQTHKTDGRPSVQWYFDDWMTDYPLRRCRAFDRGIWMDMLAVMWSAPRRGFLETFSGKIGSEALARIVGESESDVKQSLIRLEAEGVFSKDEEGTIYNRRMARDWKQHRSKVEAGRKGGKTSKTQAKQAPSTPSPTPSPASTPKKRTPPDPALKVRFETFWNAYGKKVKKADALKMWIELRPTDDLLREILVALQWQNKLNSWTKDGGQFKPYPGTWLKAKRWKDEPDADTDYSKVGSGRT